MKAPILLHRFHSGSMLLIFLHINPIDQPCFHSLPLHRTNFEGRRKHHTSSSYGNILLKITPSVESPSRLVESKTEVSLSFHPASIICSNAHQGWVFSQTHLDFQVDTTLNGYQDVLGNKECRHDINMSINMWACEDWPTYGEILIL